MKQLIQILLKEMPGNFREEFQNPFNQFFLYKNFQKNILSYEIEKKSLFKRVIE